MDRQQKKIAVKSLKKYFEESEGVVVTHYLGLNTSELTEFREKVTKIGSKFCVAKNSLIILFFSLCPQSIVHVESIYLL